MKHLLFLIVSVICGAQACTISVNRDITDSQPLILIPSTTLNGNAAYFLPISGDVISFSEGETLFVACPGSTVRVREVNNLSEQVEATCKRSGKFNIANQTVLFDSISCSRDVEHIARDANASCLINFKEVEIGFRIESRFIRHITICFDPIAQNSVYSEFDLTSAIGGCQTKSFKAKWSQDGFYNLDSRNLNKLYTMKSQLSTINNLLGSPNITYIDETNFFSRGHLTARLDFVFGSQQRLTFHFVNAAPQWEKLNGGNWKALEESVRDFSASRNLSLRVYTGTHGVITLPHASTNEQIPLYLYVNGNTRAIPVPEYFWKIVYNPINKSAIAFVGVNNPYRRLSPLCRNICNRINWVTWRSTDVNLGYSYCCSVAQLRRRVPTIPNFRVSGVLT